MLVAFTTSINYSDYLAATLPYLKAAVDRVVVITAPHDYATREVAACQGAETLCTNAFFRNGAVFAKGSAINVALQAYREELENCWLLHVDADVIVPKRPETSQLATDILYGAQRVPIIGEEGWRRFQQTGRVRACSSRRITKPIGFYQLWHSSNWQDYPEASDNASWDDMEFIKRFQRYRVIEHVYHLQTSDLQRRCNWNGRVSAVFNA